MTIQYGVLGIGGRGETTPDLAIALRDEIKLVSDDIARLEADLAQTGRVKALVVVQVDRFRNALARLEADVARLDEKESAQRRFLRDRRVVLVDLQAEIK